VLANEDASCGECRVCQGGSCVVAADNAPCAGGVCCGGQCRDRLCCDDDGCSAGQVCVGNGTCAVGCSDPSEFGDQPCGTTENPNGCGVCQPRFGGGGGFCITTPVDDVDDCADCPAGTVCVIGRRVLICATPCNG
jgi:hypothetical protein